MINDSIAKPHNPRPI